MATFLWGVFLLFLLPDTIASCDFLNEREKIYAEHRVEFAGTGKIRHEWKRDQVIECLMDPKTFLFLSVSVLTQVCELQETRMAILLKEKIEKY